jgi:hypothetical protein
VFGIRNGQEGNSDKYLLGRRKKGVPLMWPKEFLTHVVFGEQHMSASEDATVGAYRRLKVFGRRSRRSVHDVAALIMSRPALKTPSTYPTSTMTSN